MSSFTSGKNCQQRMTTTKCQPLFIALLMIVLTLSTNYSSAEPDEQQPIVNVPTLGRIGGSQLSSSSGRKFHAFRAIPYAEPPVGNLRFNVRSNKIFRILKCFFKIRAN
jgi:hypothetical protein